MAAIVKPQRIQPAIVEFVDIAGLVAGASKGEGLGNQFLANIRETDAIVSVVRCFDDDNVVHVSGRVDPLADIETILTELALADLVVVERTLNRESKKARAGDKEAQKLVGVLERLLPHLNEGQPARTLSLAADERALLKPLCLLTIKPTMYVGQRSRRRLREQPAPRPPAPARRRRRRAGGRPVRQDRGRTRRSRRRGQGAFPRRPWSRRTRPESAGARRLPVARTADLLHRRGQGSPRVDNPQVGDTAPQAAGVIHTDFERGFIRAQTIALADFLACKGEQGAKEAGKMRAEGKDYVVKDGDVLNFLFNV
jgi:ribosome-binding ATPase YchF (GTP1/OBG family)